MKKLFVAMAVAFLFAITVNAQAGAWNHHGQDAENADIYDIFVRSWTPVDMDDADIQFFVDRLPAESEVYMVTAPDGVRTYAFLSPKSFGCIAKLIPTPVDGVFSEMIIENCSMKRVRTSGKAASNRTHHIVTKPNGAVVEFDSTVTWTFHYEEDMEVTAKDGTLYVGVWLIDKLIVNDGGPTMVQYSTVEDIGIVKKRAAIVSWP